MPGSLGTQDSNI